MENWYIRLMRRCFLWVFCLLLSTTVAPQTVNVPLSHWIYDLLERWETQGYVENVYDHTKPYSRQEVSEYLVEVIHSYQQSPQSFSSYDLQYLRYCISEFQEELTENGVLTVIPAAENRFQKIRETPPFSLLPDIVYKNNRNFFSAHFGEFDLYSDPIFQYSTYKTLLNSDTLATVTRWSNGLLFRGNLGKNLGFYFNLTDNHFSRKPGYPLLQVQEESGFPFVAIHQSKRFDVDENIAYLNLTHKYFSLFFGRDYNQWGGGHSGQLVLSTNAPVYDQIKLTIRYWRFKYTHLTAFLQYIPPEGRKSIKAFDPIDVYWAGNRLEMYLGRGFQLGLSQTVIYGNQSLKPGYLNPLAFFKSMEHYYGDRDNGAISIDAAWRVRNGVRLYGEWFIDDLSTTKLGSDFFGNKFGYQLGVFLVNPLGIPGSDFLVEYTRIKPYVYSHSVQDYNKYKHYDTILGHAIGPNSDDLLVRYRYAPHRRLRVEFSMENYRHGENPEGENVGGDPDFPFRFNIDNPSAPFLEGELLTRFLWNMGFRYELLRNTFLLCRVTGIHSNREGGTTTFFSFRLSYNFGQRPELMPAYQPATR